MRPDDMASVVSALTDLPGDSRARSEYVCARCARIGPTCCFVTPGEEQACFPLSVAEKDRIREALPDVGAFAMVPNSPRFLEHMLKLFPRDEARVRELFPERKEHMRLATDAQGNCRLLGPEGCLLPVESRPYYCRVFPFWFQRGQLTAFLPADCLAAREKRSVAGLLKTFGVAPVRLRELFGRLRLAWGLDPAEDGQAVPPALARQAK